MNNAVFAKSMENVKKHRDIKLATTERRTNYLESEPNVNTTKLFTENLLVIEMKKQRYLLISLSIQNFQYQNFNPKILMFEFWYDYVKSKYGKKQNCVIWIKIIVLLFY